MEPLQVNKNHDVLAWVNFPIICYSLLIFVGKEFWRSIVTSIKLIFQVEKEPAQTSGNAGFQKKAESYFKVACCNSYPKKV